MILKPFRPPVIFYMISSKQGFPIADMNILDNSNASRKRKSPETALVAPHEHVPSRVVVEPAEEPKRLSPEQKRQSKEKSPMHLGDDSERSTYSS